MKTIAILICAVAISIGFVGCQTSAPPTTEAVKFYTFKDTWTAVHSSYQAYCELVVQGKVSKADEAEVDKAWNQFRIGFKAAVMAANNGSRAAPADVEKLKDDFIPSTSGNFFPCDNHCHTPHPGSRSQESRSCGKSTSGSHETGARTPCGCSGGRNTPSGD